VKERERERKRRGKTLLKNIAHTTEKKRRRIKINEREREDRRVLFIRDKKRYKDIYITTNALEDSSPPPPPSSSSS
jgi:hypothetical protein